MDKTAGQIRREERRQQLLQMWRDRRGRDEVLRMFHRALAAGEVPAAGISVMEVILDSEFGAENDVTDCPPRTQTITSGMITKRHPHHLSAEGGEGAMQSDDERLPESNDTLPFPVSTATDSLRAAMGSMKGQAEFAILESIYRVACDQFAFQYSMKTAADLLAAMPDVRIEEASALGEYRILASRYWSSAGPHSD